MSDAAAEVAYEMEVFLHGAKMAPPVAPGWLLQIEEWRDKLRAGRAVQDDGLMRREREAIIEVLSGPGRMGDTPSAVADRIIAALARLRAAPPLHDPTGDGE